MAVTANLYDHSAKLLGNKEVNFANLRFMLLNGSGTFNAAHTAIENVAGAGSPSFPNQVEGHGWPFGGYVLTGAAVTQVTTNDAKLDADDIEVLAVGGSIGPALYGVIWDVDSGKPLVHVNFDGSKEAGASTQFKVVWNAAGIVTFTVA